MLAPCSRPKEAVDFRDDALEALPVWTAHGDVTVGGGHGFGEAREDRVGLLDELFLARPYELAPQPHHLGPVCRALRKEPLSVGEELEGAARRRTPWREGAHTAEGRTRGCRPRPGSASGARSVRTPGVPRRRVPVAACHGLLPRFWLLNGRSNLELTHYRPSGGEPGQPSADPQTGGFTRGRCSLGGRVVPGHDVTRRRRT